MADLYFTETMDSSYYEALETLFFFNPLQSRYSAQIMEAIDRYGTPRIQRKDGKITMHIQGQPESRCISAFYGPKLVGIMLYIQGSGSRTDILHIAIDADCAQGGTLAELNLVPEMLRAVQPGTAPDRPYEYYIGYTGRSVLL
jgi:hypothetical protein